MAVPTTPILNTSPAPSSVPQPQFAELLTPAKLRGRKRRQDPLGTATGWPLKGFSRLGFTTEDGDLYIGALRDPTSSGRPEDDAITIASIDSTSSSWSWGSGNLERGRRATMAVIERVGEAFGVLRGSPSSTSISSSSSSLISDHSRSETYGGRRRRYSRITRTLSRATKSEASPERPRRQQVTRKREFTLLLPKQLGASDITSVPPKTTGSSTSDRVITSPDLTMILERIRATRQAMGVNNYPPGEPISRPPSGSGRPRVKSGHPSFTAPPVPLRPSVPRAKTRIDALKGEAVPIRPKGPAELLGMQGPKSSASSTSLSAFGNESPPFYEKESTAKPKFKNCWWLDVSCPNWVDLKEIGEVMSLHPLTLEDVLQQDPREKFETFDKLGYYFVAVRALDETYFKYTPGSQPTAQEATNHGKKEGLRRSWGMGRVTGKLASKTGEKVEIIENRPGKEGLEGVGVGGVNVYLAVFADGVISFHFDDISKHTKRVLERALVLAENHSSDWIAYGILDSIVDAFFPLTGYVDGAVDDIDSLTIDPSTDPSQTGATTSPIITGKSDFSNGTSESKDEFELSEIWKDEKGKNHWLVPKFKPAKFRVKPKSARTAMKTPLAVTYLKLFFLPIISATKHKHQEQGKVVFDRMSMLRKIHEMRRLVTGLTRLLGGKLQVVTSMRKRAADTGAEVDAYLGDVQDHIMLLKTSLYHYEYILGHCQPAFMSYLNVSIAISRGATDEAVLALSTVSISIMPMMVVIGLFSMNVHIPQNGGISNPHTEADGSMSPFNWFAGVVIFIFLIGCFMVLIVRYWRWLARRKWSGIRGVDLPSFWNGFWGWE